MGGDPQTTAPQQVEVVKTEKPSPRSENLRNTIDLLQIIDSTELRAAYAKEAFESDVIRQRFEHDYRLAKVFAESGIFSDIKGSTVQQAVAVAMTKIELGRSWGISPADSIRFIYFTNGKPALETEIIAAKLQDAGYSWDVDWLRDSKEVCVGCKLWLKRLNKDTGQYQPILDVKGQPVWVEFTKADTDNAMIHENGKQIKLSEKWNYKSWPREMYFARCISRIKKWHAPNILRGAMTREEAEELPPADNPAARAIPTAGTDRITPLLRELADIGVARKDVAIKLRHDPAILSEHEIGFLRSAITAIQVSGTKWDDIRFDPAPEAQPEKAAEPEREKPQGEQPARRGRKPAAQPEMFDQSAQAEPAKPAEPAVETIAGTPFVQLFKDILFNSQWTDPAEVNKVLLKEWNIDGIENIPKGPAFQAVSEYFRNNKPKSKKG